MCVDLLVHVHVGVKTLAVDAYGGMSQRRVTTPFCRCSTTRVRVPLKKKKKQQKKKGKNSDSFLLLALPFWQEISASNSYIL